jgi:hypothetical protein
MSGALPAPFESAAASTIRTTKSVNVGGYPHDTMVYRKKGGKSTFTGFVLQNGVDFYWIDKGKYTGEKQARFIDPNNQDDMLFLADEMGQYDADV